MAAEGKTSQAEKLKIGLLMGSTREERNCDRVMKFVQQNIAKEYEVHIFDPESMDLPKTQQSVNFLFGQLSKVPQNIIEFNEKIKAMDGFIIISPEYNWSLPPGLTNMMDNVPPFSWCWKPVAFVHYSISPVGGWRVGMQLRNFAGALGLIVVPKQMGIPEVHTALAPDGQTQNESIIKEITITLQHLYWAMGALKAHKDRTDPPQWSM